MTVYPIPVDLGGDLISRDEVPPGRVDLGCSWASGFSAGFHKSLWEFSWMLIGFVCSGFG